MEESRVFPGIDLQSNNWISLWEISKYHLFSPLQDIFSLILSKNPAHNQVFLHYPICSHVFDYYVGQINWSAVLQHHRYTVSISLKCIFVAAMEVSAH